MADEPERKRSRLAQDVPDETVVNYTAARAFLLGEWFGASLMVSSFTLLYVLEFGSNAATGVVYAVCVGALALGTLTFFRSRTYYRRIGFDYAPKWHGVAAVVAGSAGIFWFLFLFLLGLAWAGIRIQ